MYEMHSGCKACGLKLMLATYMNSSVPAIHVNSGVCCVGFPNWIDTGSKLVQVDPVDSLIHRQSSYLISVQFHQRSWQRIRRLQRVLGALLGQQRCSCRGPSFWRTTRKGSWDVFIGWLPSMLCQNHFLSRLEDLAKPVLLAELLRILASLSVFFALHIFTLLPG